MDSKSLSYTKWKCQYHIVFISKYRKKKLLGKPNKKPYIKKYIMNLDVTPFIMEIRNCTDCSCQIRYQRTPSKGRASEAAIMYYLRKHFSFFGENSRIYA